MVRLACHRRPGAFCAPTVSLNLYTTKSVVGEHVNVFLMPSPMINPNVPMTLFSVKPTPCHMGYIFTWFFYGELYSFDMI